MTQGGAHHPILEVPEQGGRQDVGGGRTKASQGATHGTDLRLGQRLRQIRHSRGLTQKQLAESLNLSLKQVQNYENGRTRISVATLVRLSGVLQTSAAVILRDLLPGEGEAFPPMEGSPEVAPLSEAELAHLARLRGMPLALTRPILRLTEVLSDEQRATS